MGTRGRGLIVASAAALLTLAPAHSATADGGCANADVRPAVQSLHRTARATLCLINVERRHRGLHRLRADRRLRRAATSHARDMVHRDYFAHASLRGGTLRGRLEASGYASRRRAWSAGEALAWGTGDQATARSMVAAWMQSRHHREILLTGRFRDIGIGIARGAPGPARGGATYTLDVACRC